MYKSSLPLKKEILIHLAFWFIWLYYSFVVVAEGTFQILESNLFYNTGILVFILTFYVNYLWVLPKVFKPFNWKKALLGYGVIFLFYTCLRYLIEQIITLQLYNQQNYWPDTHIVFYFYDNLFYSSKPIIASSVLWAVIFLIRTLDYNKYILEEQKNTEIKFLKAQINPHFVFNTLNNIYSMVHFQSPHALSAIEKLGNIMRFTTYKAQQDKIKLTEEVDYIKAYIELEELRHPENGFVKLLTHLEDENMAIPPYILSPLVENALKHGTFSLKSPIEITLFCDAQHLKFEVKNEIGRQKKDKLGGIGLDNLKSRLEILFPQKHRLRVAQEGTVFLVYLEIQWK